jgi:nitronate monooxygenase
LLKTKFTDLVGCEFPIQQAGIGGIATPSLASAVANAGALGMLGLGGIQDDPQWVERWLVETKNLTKKKFGANFIPAETFLTDLSVIRDSVELASKIANVVEFFYRKPDPSLVELVHKGGALASWQVGSKEESIAAADAGCDFIIAQGVEAGGHVRGRVGLVTILSEVLDSVSSTIPVLAAGGIGSGRAMAAALSAGASGVRVGTRFVAAEECPAHPDYVKALIESKAEDTVLTETFSYGWPNAPHRVLRSCVEAAQSFKGDVVGRTKAYGSEEWYAVQRFESLAIAKETEGAIAAMPHWAGESVSYVRRVQPAADIVKELSSEAEMILNNTHLRSSGY